MHIYFSGIGGAGIGPLALVAKQAGYEVSGSDKQDSSYISYLKKHGINEIHIGQDYDKIAAIHDTKSIDWFVYTSALPMEDPNAPELKFCKDQSIKTSKRDELVNQILQDKQLKMIAIAGTHGKTTTTAIMVWAMQQLNLPISYLLPAKTSFADMGAYTEGSEYFVYEADEYDRNFLAFEPHMSIITGVDWDHPDIYPTRDEYNAAFRDFLEQSEQKVMWQADIERLEISSADVDLILDEGSPEINTQIALPGLVNRQNAWEVAHSLQLLTKRPLTEILPYANSFPGVARRFERIAPGVYSDYAHTPAKIRGALQMGGEIAGDNLVVVYEGLHNTRQHFIKEELVHLFDGAKQLYIVPSYLAREDPSLKLWTPDDLKDLISPETQAATIASVLNQDLQQAIEKHVAAGDTVLCLSAGGGKSLDEWLRTTFA